MIINFSDGALFSDGGGFTFWRPQPFAIVQRRIRVFCDPIYERERDFSDFGSTPARRHILLETTDSGGSQFEVWLCAERGKVNGWLDATWHGGPMLPLSWSPEAGLNAPAAIAWAAETFGRRHAQKVRAELAAICARLWAGVPR